MKNWTLIITLLLFVLISCNSKNKSAEVASYTYEEEKTELNAELKALVPEWVKEGVICYGLIIQIDKDKNPVKGKPVKAKVVEIRTDGVIMKALEAVSLVKAKNCTQMGLSKGQTWEEKEGDFYVTKEEAINALKAQNIYMASGKATVD